MQLDAFYRKYMDFLSTRVKKKQFYEDLLRVAEYYRSQGENSQRDYPRTEGS